VPIEIKPDPSSIRPDVTTIETDDGPKPSGVPDSEAYFAGTFDTGLGTTSFGPTDLKHYYNNLLASVSWPDDGVGITTMSPTDAAQMALVHLIARMTWQTKRLTSLASGEQSPDLTVHRLERIWLDWPRWDGRDIPTNQALITSPSEATWDPGARSSLLLDNTIGVFGEGTMIRHLGEWEVPLQLIVWFAHKDMRRGFHARIVSLLAAERARETWHRIVTVPEYFDRDVTLMMSTASRPDSPEQAQANRWPLEITLTAAVEHVELVRVPGYLDAQRPSAVVDGQT
jgi:hypothetical protein